MTAGIRRFYARKLTAATEQMGRRDRELQERDHDARSIVFGARGAAHLLTTAAPVDRARIGRLLDAELSRLEATLEHGRAEARRDFAVAEALEPVVAGLRLSGLRVVSDLPPVWAHGRARATATAVGNLLTNARVHAPGAGIVVTAVRTGDIVRIEVRDDGPGLPDGAGESLLARGVRGDSATPGQGLGLFSAAEAMRGQDGSLQVTSAPGGGTSAVLTLPAATPLTRVG